MREFLLVGDVADILGVHDRRVANWVERGIVRPAHRGRGRGNPHVFHLRDVIAIAAGRELTRKGFTLNQAAAVIEWLLNRSLDDLKLQFQEGRRLLMAVGEQVPMPYLLTWQETYENPHLPLREALQLGVPVAVVDVQSCYEAICEKVQALEAEKTERRERCKN